LRRGFISVPYIDRRTGKKEKREERKGEQIHAKGKVFFVGELAREKGATTKRKQMMGGEKKGENKKVSNKCEFWGPPIGNGPRGKDGTVPGHFRGIRRERVKSEKVKKLRKKDVF